MKGECVLMNKNITNLEDLKPFEDMFFSLIKEVKEKNKDLSSLEEESLLISIIQNMFEKIPEDITSKYNETDLKVFKGTLVIMLFECMNEFNNTK